MESIVAVGIDVAKEKLDVAVFNGKKFVTRIYPNTKEGIERFLEDVEEKYVEKPDDSNEINNTESQNRTSQTIKNININPEKSNSVSKVSKDSIHFVMEATGSYNTKVLYAISDRGYPVYVLNPIVSRRYSEEQMKRTTTDKEVSKLLAGYAYSSILSFKSGIPSESYNTLMSFKFDSSKKDNLELRVLIKTLESLMRTRTRILNEIEALNQYPDGFVDSAIESLKRLLQEIEIEIKNIQHKIDEIVNREENKDLYGRLTSIPGVGKRTASAIIAYFGEFSTFDNFKTVASYIGLTPSIKESGKSVKKKGYSISKIGNPYLRQILFMASLSASKHNPQCNTLYERLLEKGKDKKLIQIAVAHKLLRQIFAIAKYGRVYDPHYGVEVKEKEGKDKGKENEDKRNTNKQKGNTSTSPSKNTNTKQNISIHTKFPYDPPFIQDTYPNIIDY